MAALNLLDPHSLPATLGPLGVFLVMFAETELLVGFFVSGDCLLFTAGLLCTTRAGATVHANSSDGCYGRCWGSLRGERAHAFTTQKSPPRRPEPARVSAFRRSSTVYKGWAILGLNQYRGRSG